MFRRCYVEIEIEKEYVIFLFCFFFCLRKLHIGNTAYLVLKIAQSMLLNLKIADHFIFINLIEQFMKFLHLIAQVIKIPLFCTGDYTFNTWHDNDRLVWGLSNMPKIWVYDIMTMRVVYPFSEHVDIFPVRLVPTFH